MMGRRAVLGLMTGTLAVSLGGGVAGTGMAAGAYGRTIAGFALVLAGYRATQYGAHGAPSPSSVVARVRASPVTAGANAALTTVGLVLFSSGFVFGAQAGLAPRLGTAELVRMAASGVVIVTGLVIIHDSLNEVPL